MTNTENTTKYSQLLLGEATAMIQRAFVKYGTKDLSAARKALGTELYETAYDVWEADNATAR